MNAEQMVAARRARLIQRSAWTPHRHPQLTQPKGTVNHVEDVMVVTDEEKTARLNVVTGVENADGRLDAITTDRQLITETIDITEKIYGIGRGRPLTSVTSRDIVDRCPETSFTP